ncbi:MAG: DUF1778 domain-containing protein [Devosia sp.]
MSILNHRAERPAQKAGKRDTTINIRLTVAARDLIDSAASLAGKTRSEFVLESARQQATEVLLDQRLFSLEEDGFAAFLSALDKPPAPTKRLRALLQNKAPWER